MDRNTPVYHSLHSPIQAKYLRFHPKTWSGSSCLRAEVYGCQEGKYILQTDRDVVNFY